MLSQIKKNLFILILLPFLAACSKPAELFRPIDYNVANGEYNTALEVHTGTLSKLYDKDNDQILLYLDSGMLNRYAANYKDSNEKLETAEDLIFQAYGTSVSDTLASAIVNDNLAEYTGEFYEDIYINAFKALNYIALKDNESAMVEVRRVNTKLSDSRQKYEALLLEANNELQGVEITEDGKDISKSKNDLEFTDSAFARYLSMLLYRDDNKLDSAKLDEKFLYQAFSVQKSLYNFPVPSHIKEDLNYPTDKARLNLVSFAGFAPTKRERPVRIMAGGLYIKFALPAFIPRPSQINSIEVKVTSPGDSAELYPIVKLEQLESIGNIMIDTFKQTQTRIYAKSIIRATAKAGITHGIVSLAGGDSLVSAAAQALIAEATEHADVRVSRYFPGNIYTSGITVDEGVYDIHFIYKNKKGDVLKSFVKENIEVKKGRNLNLVESTYIK